MREEIAAAVVFLKRLIKKNESLTEEQVQKFCDSLSALLVEKFRNHWYEEDPMKGQGYRCIRINDSGPVDSVLDKAASNSGLTYGDLALPPELTLWVDPKEVCCRWVATIRAIFTAVCTKVKLIWQTEQINILTLPPPLLHKSKVTYGIYSVENKILVSYLEMSWQSVNHFSVYSAILVHRVQEPFLWTLGFS